MSLSRSGDFPEGTKLSARAGNVPARSFGGVTIVLGVGLAAGWV